MASVGSREGSPHRELHDAPHLYEPNYQQTRPKRSRKKFVLCFDGTGNKFSGTDSDSNILKIYRMLDRNEQDQFHYYQPGIGTYVSTNSLTHTSKVARFKSWYIKAKDSAIGTSFDQHVMGGYKQAYARAQFLMRYYSPGDDIYFFGFSRGAYTARFLAEMLDHIGLLSAGNEEMARFAWKAFQKWQTRQERTEEEKQKKQELLQFMCAFRETFSRPVRRIRFLGLFDTVNSVPRFENAWMQRSKFPYTARSTAKVIRHAVAIDERRAKFRQDLISQMRQLHAEHHPHGRRLHLRGHRRVPNEGNSSATHEKNETQAEGTQQRSIASQGPKPSQSRASARYKPRFTGLIPPENFRNRSETSGVRSLSSGYSQRGDASQHRSVSQTSLQAIQQGYDDEDSDGEGEQDIKEVWFAGCHADIGGGWPLGEGEESALSHIPLVWMVREAQRAGLRFDEEKLRSLNCCPDDDYEELEQRGRQPRHDTVASIPHIQIQAASPELEDGPLNGNDQIGESLANSLVNGTSNGNTNTNHNTNEKHEDKDKEKDPEKAKQPTRFTHALAQAATRGRMHDVLQFHNGVPALSVLSWNLMEYLPFRRMDLQADGSWRTIVWPLPKGETRDIPADAVVHHSVLRRMRADPSYRPGNLICGGGGRGMRRAPERLGMGEWKVVREPADPIGECVVRANPVERDGEAEAARPMAASPGGPMGMWIGSN